MVILDHAGDLNAEPFYDFISCLEDLPFFCKLIFYHGCQSPNLNSDLHILLELRDPRYNYDDAVAFPVTLQEKLLVAFAILKDLDGVSVKATRSGETVEKLETAIREPGPTAADYLEAAAVLKDERNTAFKEGFYIRSLKKHFEAYEAIHFIVEGKWFAIMLDGYFTAN
ncbi:hypothetical protein OEA41_002494 [Lepraria neglecta]|uniref:Uncharacterized protein n=1 Tax=Lepraria neglecta TaxID=209136 RepID=A0AAE0DMH6_9LECA|nr:hypothetical protein OEA41_002494 [Lepraria neglecta]